MGRNLLLLLLAAVTGLQAAAASEPSSTRTQEGSATFEVRWFSIDGGATRSQGAGFLLQGTLAQSDSSTSAGGPFVVTGGFLALRRFQGPCNQPSAIFCDGFESADTAAWSVASSLP